MNQSSKKQATIAALAVAAQAAAEQSANRPEWQTRLLAEYRELNDRTRKLHLALASNPQHPDREILSEQLTAMLDYEAVLRRHVAKLGEPVMPLVPDIEA